MLPTPFAELPSPMRNERVRFYHERLWQKRRQLAIKRALDVLLSGAALTLCMPLMLSIAAAVSLESPGGALYCQKRRTKDLRPFVMCKFRTMADGSDKKSLLTMDRDERVTGIGRFLRDTRLDELPQLVNVLLGEMSLVGPRPEVDRYVRRYDREMLATLLLPAGITSPAALLFCGEAKFLSGENGERVYADLILPRKTYMNLRYIERFSLWEDARALGRTMASFFG